MSNIPIGPTAGALFYRAWDPVGQHLSYLFQAKKKVEKMTDAMEDLKAKRNDLKKEIEDAEREQKRATHEVQLWLNKLEDLEGKVNSVATASTQRGTTLNLWSTYSIGRRAAKLYKKLVEMRERRSSFRLITTPIPPAPIREIPRTSKYVGNGLRLNLEKIRSYLRDQKSGVLAVWGMGGVGKTTLMKEVNNSLLDMNLGFDCVIWAAASKEPQLDKIRQDVAESLGMFPGATKEVIYNFLKKKSFLLLLDDLWKEFDVTQLGIPHPHSGGDSQNPHGGGDSQTDEKKQMVIMTTRLEWVCSSMKADETIRVDCLDADEGLELFRENVGRWIAKADRTVQRLAEEVAKECGGLPLALITVGKAMSNKKTVPQWDHTIKTLRKSRATSIRGMDESFFLLKFSYDSLRDSELQRCFLRCSLWPEDWNIDREGLIICWMGLGLIHDFADLDEAYIHGFDLIESLKEVCLLESSVYSDCVRMHDMIRELALWIASDCGKSTNRWIVRAGVGGMTGVLQEFAETWNEAEGVSLMRSNIEALPKHLPLCPRLSTLILRANRFSRIPQGFFMSISALTYLDLSELGIEEIPADIGHLVQLQFLDLTGAEISSIPDELGNLSNLKFLYLRDTPNLEALPHGLIPRLSKLRVVDVSPYIEIDPEELACLRGSLKSVGMAVRSLDTLQRLSSLTMFNLTINGVEDLTTFQLQDLSSSTRRCLKWLEISDCDALEAFIMDVGEAAVAVSEGQSTAPSTSTHEPVSLRLAREDRRKQKASKGLMQPSSSQITSGTQDTSESKMPHLPRLGTLILSNLSEFQGIVWRGSVRPGDSFQRLREINMDMCHKLKHVSWVRHLPCLTQLVLQYSNGMERVISSDEEIVREDEADTTLLSLRKLILRGLPQLSSICDQALAFPSLEEFEVRKCPQLKNLPFQAQLASNRRLRLRGSREWWDSLIWEPESMQTSFFRLSVES